MVSSRIPLLGVGLSLLAGAELLFAQHNFQRTKTVDPSGNADQTTILGALNAIGDDPTVKWTVFIYAGAYTEEVVLDDTKENIDLVGVDRDSVIIQAPANKDAITIKGFGARNNSIRNLTIITNDADENQGRGIVITRPGASGTLSNITIDGVRIQTQAADSDAISVQYLLDGLTISNCQIETQGTGSHAVHLVPWLGSDFVDNLRILNTQLIPSGGNSAGGSDDDSDGIRIEHKVKSMLVQNVHMRFDGTGLALNLLSGASGSKLLTLDGVTVRSTKARPLVDLSGSTKARLVHCDLLDADAPSNFVQVGTDTEILNCSIRVDRDSVDTPFANDDSAGLYGNGISGLRVSNSHIEGLGWGIWLDNNCTDVQISNSELVGSNFGVLLECGDNISFDDCSIVANSAGNSLSPSPEYQGVFVDDEEVAPTCEPGAIKFTHCTIQATSHFDGLSARGVYIKAAPPSTKGPVIFKDCDVSARVSVTDSGGARAYGVVADETGSIAMDGGSISSSDSDEREDIQYDVYNGSAGAAVTTSGVKYSKWKGPVAATLQPVSLTQRMVNVSAVSDTAILAATALTTAEQTITSGITQPDVLRVLSVKGNLAGMNQKVYVIGTNFANERITDVLTLSGTSRVEGVKPLKAVNKIILPAQTDTGQTVAVGNSAKLGLAFAIGASCDVLQQARKATAATSYTLEGVGSVNTTHAFVDVSVTSPITAGDSFEFAYLASR